MRCLSISLLLLAAVAACSTFPAPHLASQGSETAATVEELGPDRYHILVRINYFAPDGEAERLLRERAATLCDKGEAIHIDHLATARQPAMAAADVTCGDEKVEPSAEEPATETPAEATPPADPDTTAGDAPSDTPPLPPDAAGSD